jgi:hypothetical protein
LYRLITLVAGIVLPLGAVEMGLRAYAGWRPIAPWFFRPTPELPGYGLQPDCRVDYWHGGRVITVSTDHRGRRIVPHAPASGVPTMVHFVGDSQAFGWGLSDEETIPAQLQRRLGPEYRVINHGVPGYGPIAFKLRLTDIPGEDLVVVVHFEQNDLSDTYTDASYSLVRRGGLVPRTFLGRNLPGPVLTSHTFAKLIELKILVSDWRKPLPIGFNPLSQVAARVLRYRVDALYEGQRELRGNRLLFCNIPWDGLIVPSRLASYQPRLERPRRLVGLPDDCALDSVFLAHPRPDTLYLEDDSHLSPLGAGLVAEQLAPRIIRMADGVEGAPAGAARREAAAPPRYLRKPDPVGG